MLLAFLQFSEETVKCMKYLIEFIVKYHEMMKCIIMLYVI